MIEYQTILVGIEGTVARIALNRPDIRNAFDDRLIEEFHQALEAIAGNSEVRVLVLSGQGKTFCSGADLNWMRRMKDYRYEENFEDAYRLSKMLKRLYSMPIPTIARVHGAAIGGGVGLVAASDIVVAASDTMFSLSEVRIGLVPACISPYLLKRITPGTLRAYFLTGARFSAAKGKEIGLVNEVVESEELDHKIRLIVEDILSCGPAALKMAKDLLENVPKMQESEWMEYTARAIADLRVSAEGQEGLTAFLEKREPSWKKTM